MEFEALFEGIGLEQEGRDSFRQLHARRAQPEFAASIKEGFRSYEEGDPAFGAFLESFSARERIPAEVLNLYFYLLKAMDTYHAYMEKGIPVEVFNATLGDIAVNSAMNRARTGIYGIPQKIYRRWLRRFFACRIYQLGCLRYELISSPYDTRLGDIAVSKGDPVLSVHIPGRDFDEASLEASYAAAREFFRKHYGMETPVFFCLSWLVQPWLPEVLPPDSRIVRFQSKFKIIDFVDDPGDMLLWVFPRRFDNIEDYPEDNTLRRLTKERMRQGGILGYGVGVRL